jgi:hypothetical protein
MLLRDSESEPRVVPAIITTEHGKPLVAAAVRFLEHAAERCRIQKPIMSPEPE